MKINKVILGMVTTAIVVIGSFAFKTNSSKKFGSGTLFSKPASGCHPISCQRDLLNPNSCNVAGPYYTQSTCTGTAITAAKTVAL